MTWVCSLENFNIWPILYRYMSASKAAKRQQGLFPDAVFRTVICKPGGVVAKVLSFFTMGRTAKSKLKKINDFSELDAWIDPSQRPISFGGTNTTEPVMWDLLTFEQETPKKRFIMESVVL